MTRLKEGQVDEADLEHLYRQVDAHPGLQPFEKAATRAALKKNVLEGAAFRPFEIKHISKVFGKDVAEKLAKRTMTHRLIDLVNVPRALEASFDVSFPLRQGIVVAHSHPTIFGKSFSPMFKSLVSEKKYHELQSAIRSDPDFAEAQKAGLSFTELSDVKHREEQFASNYAEKIPGVGRVVRASGRAYTAAANSMRMGLYKRLMEDAQADKKGILGRTPGFRGSPDPHNEEFQKQIAEVANTFTGRGSGGSSWERAAPLLNNIFFSPRLIRARVNMLNPRWYAKLEPFERRQAFRALVRMAGSTALVLEAAHLAGASVGTDPRSSDFAKIKVGNTRFDIGGGFQQYIRLVAQMTSGEAISSTTGKTMKLGPGFGKMNSLDVFLNFWEGKLAPTPAMVFDFWRGTTLQGQPLSKQTEAYNKLVPLVIQDAYELQKSKKNAPLTAGGYALSALGVGIQTYGPKPKKAKGHNLGGSSGRSSNSLLRSGGSSSDSLLP